MVHGKAEEFAVLERGMLVRLEQSQHLRGRLNYTTSEERTTRTAPSTPTLHRQTLSMFDAIPLQKRADTERLKGRLSCLSSHTLARALTSWKCSFYSFKTRRHYPSQNIGFITAFLAKAAMMLFASDATSVKSPSKARPSIRCQS